MGNPAEWMMDLYLQSQVSREQVVRLLIGAGLGALQGMFSLQSTAIELDVERNPDKTGDSPFGRSPIIIGVAKPALASQSEFQAALKDLFDVLDGARIMYRAVPNAND